MTDLEGFHADGAGWTSFRGGLVVNPPPSGDGTAISGLATDTMLSMWQDRAVNGPFKTTGDFASNSPGDWDRIVSDRNTFVSSGLDLFTSHDGSSAVRNSAMRMACAALVHAVSGDTTARNSAASELLEQARVSGAQYETNGVSRTAYHDTLNGFSHWVLSLTLTYDLLKMAGDVPWTSGEDAEVKSFLYHIADFICENTDNELEKYYTSAAARYAESETATLSSGAYNGHYWVERDGTAGDNQHSLARRWNNRRASHYSAVNMVAHVLDFWGYTGTTGTLGGTANMIDHSQTFAREMLKYSVYPSGSLPDLERAVTGTYPPETHMGYVSVAIGAICEIAERARIHGDNSLWTFNTSMGNYGSEGTPAGWPGKSLLFAQTAMCDYLTDGYDRYLRGNAGNSTYRMDFRHPRDGAQWNGVLHTSTVVHANAYHQDSYIQSVLDRSHPRSGGFPSNPAGIGPRSILRGPGGAFPGWHFMYADI